MQTLGKKSFIGFVATILATTCLGFAAGGSHKSSERTTEVTFISAAKFNNGTTLPAGTYRMEVAKNSQTPSVTFTQDRKVMATIEAKVVTQPKKNEATEVDAVTQGDTEAVKAIRPAGWDEALVFDAAGQ